MTEIDPAEVLRCLVDILGAHHARLHSNPPPEAVVAPIFLDERHRFTDTVESILNTESGFLVDATTAGTGVGVSRDPRVELPELTAAVDELLADCNSVDPTGGLWLSTSGTRVAVEGATDYDAANAAQKALRELVSALFDETLRSAPIVGLIWADDSLDEGYSAAIWPLLMRLPELLRLEAGTTLLLIAGDAALNPPVHCAGPNSLFARVTDAGYERRLEWDASRSAVQELALLSEADAPLIILFLGAGASMVEGLPTGNSLRDRALARQVNLPKVDRQNYVEAALAFFERLRVSGHLRPGELERGAAAFVEQLTLERVLLEEQAQENQHDSTTIRAFRTDHDAIMASLAAAAAAGDFADDPLVRLLQHQRRLVLVTVNFDKVIETKAPNLTRRFATQDELQQLDGYLGDYVVSGGPVPLIKLHGDIEHVETLVVTVGATEAGLSAARLNGLEAVVNRVNQQAVRPWWYVGYSMRDLDLEAIWANPAFADRMVEHWVAPFVDAAVRRFLETKRLPRWQQRGSTYTVSDRAITLVANDFYRLLYEDVAADWNPP